MPQEVNAGEEDPVKSGVDQKGQKIKEASLDFPVIMRSIGDFTTNSNQKAEKDIALSFQELENFIHSDQGETISAFRQMIEDVEGKHGRKKDPQNLMQVYFPHSAGFRPVGEGGKSFSLTCGTLTTEKILGEHASTKGIVITNREFLEIHPLVVDYPLIFREKNPVFLSMIPGAAHHFVEALTLDLITPQHFIENNGTFYKEETLKVLKVILVNQLFLDRKHQKVGER